MSDEKSLPANLVLKKKIGKKRRPAAKKPAPVKSAATAKPAPAKKPAGTAKAPETKSVPEMATEAKAEKQTPPKAKRPAPAKATRPRPAPKPNTASADAPSIWSKILGFVHQWYGDWRAGRAEFISTTTPLAHAENRFEDEDFNHAYDYRPTPRLVVTWVLDALDIDYRETTFVDFGSGRGRTVLEAARRPFARCIGIEISPLLHDDAETNLRHWPRSQMKCRDIDYINDSITRAPLPDGDLIIWMDNPVTDRLMTRIAGRLAEAAGERQITLVYANAVHAMPFEQAKGFEAINFKSRKLQLLSPFKVLAWRIKSAG